VPAIALVGSHARDAARDDSDIDLVILTGQPFRYLEDVNWAERFDGIENHQTENYGKLISLRSGTRRDWKWSMASRRASLRPGEISAII